MSLLTTQEQANAILSAIRALISTKAPDQDIVLSEEEALGLVLMLESVQKLLKKEGG